MSWDVVILDYSAADGYPSDRQPKPLGPANAVRAAITKTCPAVDWADPTWGRLTADEWSIEFNMGDQPIVNSLMLHVRGDGDPVPTISAVCSQNAWVALDTSTGELLDLSTPSRAGWDDFRRFCDNINAEIQPAPHDTVLPESGLSFDDKYLYYRSSGAVVATHDLREIQNVRVGRVVNLTPLVWAGICLGIGVFAKMAVQNWLGWLCLVVSALLAVFFATVTVFSAVKDTLSFDINGKRILYPIVDESGRVDAFHARFLAAVHRNDTQVAEGQ